MAVILFGGVILGVILMFFVLAWGAAAVVISIPLILIVVKCIQIFLGIRDQYLDD